MQKITDDKIATGQWVKTLLNALDETVEEEKKREILGQCGANCPFTHLPDEKLLMIKRQSRNEQDFLEKLCDEWRLEKTGNAYHVVFDQCYCPLVNKDISGASGTLCYCTLGNLKHKFKIGLNREVEVVMEKTVLAGDDECRFRIKL